MHQSYDSIVIGLGAMGSASLYHLARAGQRTLGLEAYPRRHHNGSSHGRSRIIRKAYFERSDYVPLLLRAYDLWHELEAESGTHLFTTTGGLTFGVGIDNFAERAATSAKLYDIPHEILSAAEVNARFPGFHLTDEYTALYEPDAGYLQPELSVEAHLDMAIQRGAAAHHSESVRLWATDGAGVVVETDVATYHANRLIITAGPWAGEVLADLGLPLEVRRIVNVHFEPTKPELFTSDRFPVFIFSVPEGDFYGFPNIEGEGVKFGRHDGGEVCTPHTIRREIDQAEIEELRTVLNRYMPGSAGAVKWTLTCMYTMTPDHHFILDKHPEHSQVVYGCGFSGHGFKFSTVIGEILAGMAVNGSSPLPIEFLSANRFALTR